VPRLDTTRWQNMASWKRWGLTILCIDFAVMIVAYAWGYFYHSQIGSLSFITIGDFASVFLGLASINLFISIAHQRPGRESAPYWLIAMGVAASSLQRLFTLTASLGITPKNFGDPWLDAISLVGFLGGIILIMRESGRTSYKTESDPTNHKLLTKPPRPRTYKGARSHVHHTPRDVG
jgi:hypothetical protein